MNGWKIAWAAGAVLAIAAAGGCTGSGRQTGPTFVDASAAPRWSEPAAYRFVLTRGCDAGSPLGRYRVAVRNGAVTGSTRLDHPDAEPSASAGVELGPVTGDGEEIDVPTLKGLLGLVQTASDDGGQTSEYFDGRDGHPVKVSFNTSDNDDPSKTECFSVTDYQVG